MNGPADPGGKTTLRATLRAGRRALDPACRASEAGACADRLWVLVATAAALASYCALPDELDLDALHRRWWVTGRPLWLPRVVGPGILAWHPVQGTDQLVTGSYGIREPDPARIPAAPLPSGATVLVPGIGFGADGRRLGQGGGFYDRFLLDHRGPIIGVGFACQRRDDLPEDPHDRRCDQVVLGGTLLSDHSRP